MYETYYRHLKTVNLVSCSDHNRKWVTSSECPGLEQNQEWNWDSAKNQLVALGKQLIAIPNSCALIYKGKYNDS